MGAGCKRKSRREFRVRGITVEQVDDLADRLIGREMQALRADDWSILVLALEYLAASFAPPNNGSDQAVCQLPRPFRLAHVCIEGALRLAEPVTRNAAGTKGQHWAHAGALGH